MRLEPVLHNKRSHCNEKPAHLSEEKPQLAATRESLHAADPTQPKIKKKKENLKIKKKKEIKVHLELSTKLGQSHSASSEVITNRQR